MTCFCIIVWAIVELSRGRDAGGLARGVDSGLGIRPRARCAVRHGVRDFGSDDVRGAENLELEAVSHWRSL
jgi:hypothetical protein